MLGILKKVSRNKIFYCMLFLIILMFPATIYRQSDNNTKLIVTTIGIDKDENGYIISSLAVIPKTSTDVNANLETFEGSGNTISEALDHISLNTGKQIGLAHCDCIIVSREIMEDNIAIVLDFFIRTANLTTNAGLLASATKSKDLVEVSKNSNNLFDLTLKDIVTNEEKSTLLNSITIENFYRSYFSRGGTFFLPILSSEKQNSIEGSSSSQASGGDDNTGENSSGAKQGNGKIKNEKKIAVLNRGKYVRTLTDDENFIYNMLSRNSDNLNIQIENINDKYTTQSLEVYNQINKISLPLYRFDNGKPFVQYEIWLNIMLEEVQSQNNFSYASIDSLQNFISEAVEKELLKTIDEKRKSTVKTMQEEKNDILNLYAKFNGYRHKEWKEYLQTLDDEDDYLANMDIRINVNLSYVI